MVVVLLLCLCPDPTFLVTDRVDLIEVNHFYMETGAKALCQVIFWEWSQYNRRFQVVDFRIIEEGDPYSGPYRPRGRRYYVYMWWDHRDHVMRRVTAPQFRETRTLDDPEMLDRNKLSRELRRGLSPPPKERKQDE